ncbi:hypothetical protein [Pseudonocardia thermophila]|uniref:hypothetical protein n=1 Tax=Pseudonocardia thermophila TaxID=1848 RepID=UPI00248DE23A|nr:hypothetical protein [Pseudonocardia thermophila]
MREVSSNRSGVGDAEAEADHVHLRRPEEHTDDVRAEIGDGELVAIDVRGAAVPLQLDPDDTAVLGQRGEHGPERQLDRQQPAAQQHQRLTGAAFHAGRRGRSRVRSS